jgi:hypothetical protein
MPPGSLRRIGRRSTDEGLEVLVTHGGDFTAQVEIVIRGYHILFSVPTMAK